MLRLQSIFARCNGSRVFGGSWRSSRGSGARPPDARYRGTIGERATRAGEGTPPLFATTVLARGASKSGSYIATVAGRVTFATAGTGDADLYVRKGGTASRSTYTCKSDGDTAVESCGVDVTVGDSISYLVYAY